MARAAIVGLLLAAISTGSQLDAGAQQAGGAGFPCNLKQDCTAVFSWAAQPEGPRIARPDLDRYIVEVASCQRVDPALVLALIRVESEGDPTAISPKGAMGLMQLTPATAARFGVHDALDPYQNILGGVKDLQYLMHRYPNRLSDVIAAYTLGEGGFDRTRGEPLGSAASGYVTRVLAARKDLTADADGVDRQ